MYLMHSLLSTYATVIMHSTVCLSVSLCVSVLCTSVCPVYALTFKSIGLDASFLGVHVFKVIDSRSQEKKMGYMSITEFTHLRVACI